MEKGKRGKDGVRVSVWRPWLCALVVSGAMMANGNCEPNGVLPTQVPADLVLAAKATAPRTPLAVAALLVIGLSFLMLRRQSKAR